MDWAEATGAHSWSKLYDRYYRKQQMYRLAWGDEIDLAKMKVAGAPFAGPVALLRDSSKISMVTASTLRKCWANQVPARECAVCTVRTK